MKRIQTLARRLCSRPSPGLELRVVGERIEVRYERTGRSQSVAFRRVEDHYEFTSMVLRHDAASPFAGYDIDLLLMAWERNQLTDLVLFGLDGDGNLVGRIVHPARTLDEAEFRLYVETLLEECDRFEYVLTGDDAN